MAMMTLRPHHLLDIITHFGEGGAFAPHPYGHAVHTVAEAVLADPEIEVEFVIAADDICRPCIHLQPDGSCDDLRSRTGPLSSKQEYNDDLDRRLCEYLPLDPGTVMTVRRFLEIVNAKVPGIEEICTHTPGTEAQRLKGLTEGLRKLGIRDAGGA